MKNAQVKIDMLFNLKQRLQPFASWLLVIVFIAFSSLAVLVVRGGNFISYNSPAQEEISGEWQAAFDREISEDELHFTIIPRTPGIGRNTLNSGISLSNLKGLTLKQVVEARTDVSFQLAREAGTLQFDGSFQDGKGSGLWTFIPSQGFTTSMLSSGYKLTQNDLLEAALFDVTTRLVEDLKSVGFHRLKFPQLLTAANHNVTSSFIRDVQSAGYRNLSIEEFSLARNHGIDSGFIKEAQLMGFNKQPLEKLISLRNHGITPNFISQMRSVGFKNLSVNQLVGLKNLGVTPEFISDLKAEGYSDLTPENAAQLKNHQIDRAFIQRVKARGFANLTLNQLIRLRNYDIIK